jgi:hypothetical protein
MSSGVVFVDYAWAQLGTLNNVLVVLLIAEVSRHKQVFHLSEHENACKLRAAVCWCLLITRGGLVVTMSGQPQPQVSASS